MLHIASEISSATKATNTKALAPGTTRQNILQYQWLQINDSIIVLQLVSWLIFCRYC